MARIEIFETKSERLINDNVERTSARRRICDSSGFDSELSIQFQRRFSDVETAFRVSILHKDGEVEDITFGTTPEALENAF
jgi:hypothetical protein